MRPRPRSCVLLTPVHISERVSVKRRADIGVGLGAGVSFFYDFFFAFFCSYSKFLFMSFFLFQAQTLIFRVTSAVHHFFVCA